MAITSDVTWPDTSRARFAAGSWPLAATNSRLPRRASAASVPDRARIDQRLDHEREERPVLVLEVAAQRPDVDRLAGQALQDRRHCRDDGTISWRDSGVANWDTIAALTPMRMSPRMHADEDGRPARVADRLAEDAAVAVEAARERDRAERGCDAPVWTSVAMSGHLDRVAAVLGEECLLERGLAADEVDELVLARQPGRPADRAADPHRQGVVRRRPRR